MTDENVNEVNENDEQSCCSDQGDSCGGDSGSDCCSSDGSGGGGSFKKLLFLIIIVLAGVVVAKNVMNKNRPAACPTGVVESGTAPCCPSTAAMAKAVADQKAMADKSASCPTMDKTAVCPTEAAKADATCPSMAK